MGARASSAATAAALLLVIGLGFAAMALLPAPGAAVAAALYVPAGVTVAVVSMAVVVWRVDPAYTFSAAILLTPFAGNWPRLGVPGPLSPDRLLLAGAVIAVLLRAPPVADRPRIQFSRAHWLLALVVVYALISALLAGTLSRAKCSSSSSTRSASCRSSSSLSLRGSSGPRISAVCCSAR